ncbi:hypothetical protein [Asticcacaulis solisilvae]|uniref:hypothetical protein n=1 Tax=Asticcacaulis solisilvae TaxID=1217274 RepID=UPI003FD7AB53
MRSRLVFQVLPDERIAIARYIGDIGGDRIVPELQAHLETLDQPWTWDMIIDLRRHEGIVGVADYEAMAAHWKGLAKGLDIGRRSAAISSDPLVGARLTVMDALFPGRIMGAFMTMEDARDWLRQGRASAAA